MSVDVVITDAMFPDVDKERAAAEALGASFELHDCKTPEDVVAAVKGAKVAVVQFAELNANAIAGLAPGATVIRYGVGYNNLDVAAMNESNVQGVYIPDYCTSEVADHTAAMILAQLRKLDALDASVRANEWAAVKVAKPMKAFSDTKIGFFGFGRIAQAVAGRLAPFGFQFLASDPFFDATKNNALNVESVSFDALIRDADCISLHAPATPETIGRINADVFTKMKPTSFLVNSARGDLIDETALAVALTSGDIGGASIDVFHQEPLPADSPLRQAPNLTMSPHAAWYSDVAVESLQSLVADEVTRALNGKPARCPIPGSLSTDI
ncbi:MAG: C-terminal binding protein [Hyphomicrobiales bacterium]